MSDEKLFPDSASPYEKKKCKQCGTRFNYFLKDNVCSVCVADGIYEFDPQLFHAGNVIGYIFKLKLSPEYYFIDMDGRVEYKHMEFEKLTRQVLWAADEMVKVVES